MHGMGLTLVQLQTFARVAVLGSFTRAAEDLHLTQPAVTQQVHVLERHFGLRLVEVVGRRPVLTEAGRFLAERAASVLGSVAAIEHEMGEFAEARSGELRLGATLTIGAYTLPALLARFHIAHPGVMVRVAVANTAATMISLHQGDLSLALIEGPLQDDTVHVVPFQDDRLVLVVPPGHRFAGRATVQPHELAGEPFVWREEGSGTRSQAEHALAGVAVRTVLELPSGEGVARTVEAGLGLAILSALVVERAVTEGRLVAVDLAGVSLRRTFRLVSLRGRAPSPAARAFTALVRSDYHPQRCE